MQTKYRHSSNTFSKRISLSTCLSVKASQVALLIKNPPAGDEETGVWFRDDALGEEIPPASVFFPGKSCEQRSPMGYSPWDHRVRRGWAHNGKKLRGWVWIPRTGWWSLPNLLSYSGKQWNHWTIIDFWLIWKYYMKNGQYATISLIHSYIWVFLQWFRGSFFHFVVLPPLQYKYYHTSQCIIGCLDDYIHTN